MDLGKQSLRRKRRANLLDIGDEGLYEQFPEELMMDNPNPAELRKTLWEPDRGEATRERYIDELSKVQWDSDSNPWKREALRSSEDKRYLEGEVLRLQNKVMSLTGELNRMRSPPLIVGTVVDMHGDDQYVISTAGGPSFVVTVLSNLDRELIDIGSRVAMNKDSMCITAILPSSKDPLIGSTEVEERPDVGFDGIGGLEEQIRELKEVVELPLTRPELFREVGIEPPKGVLLIGPPGCGKTLLAKAIAKETRATFLRIVGSELVQKYIGEGSRMVRELFQLARERSPSILFLDELDAIAGSRTDASTSADREVQRTLIQLLAELDGFDPLGDVRIIAATNRPDILDPAILRPGRLDRIISIPLPDAKARLEILKVHTRSMNLSEDVSLDELAAITDGLNGAQIKAVCTEAGMFAIREERGRVSMEDMRLALRKLKDTRGESGGLSLRARAQNREGHSMFA